MLAHPPVNGIYDDSQTESGFYTRDEKRVHFLCAARLPGRPRVGSFPLRIRIDLTGLVDYKTVRTTGEDGPIGARFASGWRFYANRK